MVIPPMRINANPVFSAEK